MNETEMEMQKSISLLENVRTWQQRVIQGVLLAMVILGGLAVVGALYDAYVGQVMWQAPIFLGAYALLAVITFWRRVSHTTQAGVLLILLYSMGVFNLFIAGQTGDGFPFLMTVPLMAALFFGRRTGMIVIVITILTLAVFGWAFVSGHIVIPVEELSDVADLGSWISRILVFLMLTLLLVLPQNYLFRRLVTALTQSRELTQELEDHRAKLEAQVVERTADLTRRAHYLEATAEVARDATSMLDLDELLTQVATLVSERFSFYHTGIFLLDPTGEWAVLQAASSEGGQRMLARGHRLRVGQEGIVGYVTGQGKPRIALDVGTDAVFFDNPDLPRTRSEMALPLQARGEIIGALDVQSTEPEAFSDEDVAVLQTLADQVAVAISNARLFQQAEESLEAERRAYGELTRQAWAERARDRRSLGYRYDESGVTPLAKYRDTSQPGARHATASPGEPRAGGSERRSTPTEELPGLTLPVNVRGQVIGAINAHKPRGTGEWTAEEVTVMETLAEQLEVALESARLYQDTQRRAARDRLTSEITARIRETLDIETLLKTAAEELYQAMDLDEIVIRLSTDEADGNAA